MGDLIKLQHSHVNQLTKDKEKSVWTVCENVTNTALHDLPKELNEKQVFAVMAFAKKFELIAFNEGIKFGKTKNNEAKLLRVIKELTDRNALLATKLQQAIARV